MLFQGTRPGSICKSQHPQIIVKQERELGMSIQKMGENQYVVWDNDCWTPRFIGTYDECFAFKKKLEEVEVS